ncbi:MAG: phosphomannomutase/phosphoglucomutase [Methylotenera sp.]|nr:phosphomannomutase/phosphoglucomutase [Oligoflexia bacterium]
MKVNPSIFREYDIRGVAGKDLTPEFAEHLGQAYARYIQPTKGEKPAAGRARLTVSVGWDCRLTSESYQKALVRGLTHGGLDVICLGICPTPLTYFSVFHLNLDGAIMITGSHNPGDYNGFKICVGRDTLHGPQIQAIRILMEAPVVNAPLTGTQSQLDIIPLYTEHLLKIARPLRKKKIVLDAGNGTASTVAPELFRRLGADVIELYCTLDGTFPNHHPDPTVPDNLKELVATVVSEGADFGIGFDGDSDRIGLVDEKGRILYGDEILVMFARDILKEHPGATIISDVKSSHRLFDDITQRGGKAIMWKTGHSLIKSKMKETGALLAGEFSAHIFFADRYFGFDDAIYAALRVYEIASDLPGPLSSVLSDLPPTVTTPEIRVDCMEEKKFELVHETRKRLAETYTVNALDGVRVDLKDGWGLLRASNTQPVVVLRFEATTQSRLNEIQKTIESALSDAASAIGHPPLKLH